MPKWIEYPHGSSEKCLTIERKAPHQTVLIE